MFSNRTKRFSICYSIKYHFDISESWTQGRRCIINKWAGWQWSGKCTRLFGRKVWHIQIDTITRPAWRSSFYQSIATIGISCQKSKSNSLGSWASAYFACQGKAMFLDIASAKLNGPVYHRCQWYCFQTNGEICGQVSHAVFSVYTTSIELNDIFDSWRLFFVRREMK